jgi:CRP-like cAMP-binding protein
MEARSLSLSADQHMRNTWAPIQEFTDEQWEQLMSVFTELHLARGESHAVPGDKLYELAFVHTGLLRFYYVDEQGDEWNKAFICEGEFGGSLAAKGPGEAITYGVQALEDTVLLRCDLVAFRSLYDEGPAFEHLGRELAELQLRRKETLARNMIQYTAAQRYELLRTRSPWMLQRIPQYHIASHLGITEVSLSRIRHAAVKPDRS